MIRMTKQADYGIVLMSRLAGEPARQYSAPELADVCQLPLPTVSKILKTLARGRLLTSHRGVKGGYTLARRPEDISVAAIISALDGPIAITECIDDAPGDCPQEPFCPVRGNWLRINDAIRTALEQIPLAEMAQTVRPQTLVAIGGRPAEDAASNA